MKIAVVGAGEWGQNHIRILKELNALAFVFDITQKENVTITDKKEYLDKLNDVDAVSIVTPSNKHFEYIESALTYGKDVFVEKPMVLNEKQAEYLYSLALENKRLIMVGHIMRYNPSILELKKLINMNIFGQIKFLSNTRVSLMKPRKETNLVYDYMIHDFSLFPWLFDLENYNIERVSSLLLPDFITGSWLMNGIFCNSINSWLSYYKIRQLVLGGTEKTAVVNYHFNSQKLVLSAKEEMLTREFIGEPLKLELEDFIKKVKNHDLSETRRRDGLKTIQMAELVHSASKVI